MLVISSVFCSIILISFFFLLLFCWRFVRQILSHWCTHTRFPICAVFGNQSCTAHCESLRNEIRLAAILRERGRRYGANACNKRTILMFTNRSHDYIMRIARFDSWIVPTTLLYNNMNDLGLNLLGLRLLQWRDMIYVPIYQKSKNINTAYRAIVQALLRAYLNLIHYLNQRMIVTTTTKTATSSEKRHSRRYLYSCAKNKSYLCASWGVWLPGVKFH